MKTALITLALVGMTQGVLANQTKKNQKKVIDRQSYESYTYRTKRDAKNNCEARLAAILNEAESNLDTHFDKGYEYECSEIEFSTKTDFDTVGHVGSMYRVWTAVDHKYTVELTINCVPRKLSEKALFAMARRCEENPTAACFDDELLSKLDAIGTTEFSYKHKGSTCQPLD